MTTFQVGLGIPQIDDISLPYLLITQNSDKKFREMWLTDHSQYNGDDSNADFALMCELAVLTQNDAAKMEKYFSESKLGQRDKWTTREDYRQSTIKAAIEAARKEKKTGTDEPANGLEFHLPAVPREYPRPYVLAPLSDAKTNDGWFPKSEVSIICAPSGASKTTWLYQMLLAQRSRGTFLGHQGFGRPFHVMAVDRGDAASEATLERMHLPLDAIPFTRLRLDCFDVPMVQKIVNAFEDLNPRPEILVIEGADIMVSEVGHIHA